MTLHEMDSTFGVEMMKLGALRLACLLTFSVTSWSAWGGDFDQLQTLSQSEFRSLSKDLGASLSFRGIIPAEGLGITGFDVGVAGSLTSLDEPDLWRKAGSSVGDSAGMTSLRVTKGLPFGVDIGAMVATVPNTGFNVLGGEVRWAAIEGDVIKPAVAFRLGATQTSGLGQLKVYTTSVDVSMSKGFFMFTPFAGIGSVTSSSRPDQSTGLKAESFTQFRWFGGVNMNLGFINVALEADKTGDTSSTSLKLGYRF